MHLLLCGMAGVGKSFFLQQIRRTYSSISTWDLDEELSIYYKRAIAQFAQLNNFRARERAMLKKVLTLPNAIVALGGGSLGSKSDDQLYLQQLSDIFQHAHLLWIKDDLDRSYRQLGEHHSLKRLSFAEYQELYQQRIFFYRQANYFIDLPSIRENLKSDQQCSEKISDHILVKKVVMQIVSIFSSLN